MYQSLSTALANLVGLSPTNFEENLKAGKVGESLIARFLRGRGYSVLPVYEKEIDEGKGPVLFTARAGVLIAPDMLVFNQRQMAWIEAKTKSAFTWHRATACWNTGINLPHWEDYLKIAEISPISIWIFFLHLNGEAKDTPEGMTSPTGLFGNSLKYLREHEHHRWVDMVYWGLMDLKKIADLEEVVRYSSVTTL